jgi:glycerophosphoryl diester phosphodiesterase
VTSAARPRLKRVGHKGADALAPGNTRESFVAAVEAGVDMIEFDLLRRRDGRIILAHDPEDAYRREPLELEEGLDVLAAERFAGVELDIDLKHPGFEREVIGAMRSRGLLERSFVSSMYRESIDRVGELAPGLPRGWSVPRVRRDYTRRRWAVPAYVVSRYMRARLPAQASAMLAGGHCEAVVAHWMLVSEALVHAVHAAGGELYVWTVDHRTRLEHLAALGVDAVISNDPRLFDGMEARGSHLRAPASGR